MIICTAFLYANAVVMISVQRKEYIFIKGKLNNGFRLIFKRICYMEHQVNMLANLFVNALTTHREIRSTGRLLS